MDLSLFTFSFLLFSNLAGGLQTIHLWHLAIHEHQIIGCASNSLYRFLPIFDDINTIADFLKHSNSHFLVDDIIFCQKNVYLCLSLGLFNGMSSDQGGGMTVSG